MKCDQVIESLALHASSSITLAVGSIGVKTGRFRGVTSQFTSSQS